jgi:MFS family permease
VKAEDTTTAVAPETRRRAVGASLGRTFVSLRVRNFRIFVAGQLLSASGTWMQSVAAPWLVLQLTHSGVALGIDTALQFLPILLFGAWGGVLADRFDKRKIQIFTQIAFAVPAFGLWALVVTHVVHVWMVYALSFVSGTVLAIDMPTRQSFYLEMVGPDDLTNAMSLNTATFNGARLIGPVIAGVLIAAAKKSIEGTAPVFLINGISYFAVVLALLAMRPADLRRGVRVARRKGQIREGISYVWRTPALRLPILVMGAVFLVAFNFSVLLPLLAVRTFHGDAGTYGVLLSLFGAGSLAGALGMAARSGRANTGKLSVWAVALGAVTLGVAAAPQLWVEWLLMPLLGATGIGFAITANSTLQLTSSDAMRGRVMALYTVVFLGSTPVGASVAGWVGEHLGPRAGLFGGAVVALAAGALGLAALQASPERRAG